MTQLMEMKNGLHSLSSLDLAALSNLNYKTHGRGTVIAIPKANAASPAIKPVVEPSLRIAAQFQDDDDAAPADSPMDSHPEQACASVTSYTTQLWSMLLALVWAVSMATWCTCTTLVMRFVAAFVRVRMALRMAFHLSGEEDEIDMKDSKDDVDMMRLIRYLVDCAHAQASETDARDTVVRACAQHDAAKRHIETTLALWPVVEIGHETCAQTVDLYASISVAVEDLATRSGDDKCGYCGGGNQVEREPVPLDMTNSDAGDWV